MDNKIPNVGDFVYYNGPPLLKDYPKEGYLNDSINDAKRDLICGKCYKVTDVALDYASIKNNHWYYIEGKNWFSHVCFGKNDNREIMEIKYGLK